MDGLYSEKKIESLNFVYDEGATFRLLGYLQSLQTTDTRMLLRL